MTTSFILYFKEIRFINAHFDNISQGLLVSGPFYVFNSRENFANSKFASSSQVSIAILRLVPLTQITVKRILIIMIKFFNRNLKLHIYCLLCVLDTYNLNWLVSCTLRSGLHEIPAMIRNFPRGLAKNHACNSISDTFPGMRTYILFLKNYLKSIFMYICSPIQV